MTIPNYQLIQGDNREVMKGFADASFDSIVCDAPYELGFMGKAWDKSGIANDVDMWREAYRVLKPGGYLLSFSGSRTYHRMTCAIEDAGFEIRDQLMWLYGSGMPKGEAWTEKKANKGHAESVEMIAAGYEGWARAGLKPAHEPVCMARKPFSGNVAAHVLAHGVGALNIDACRIPTDDVLRVGAGATWDAMHRYEGRQVRDDYARNCSGDRGHGGTRGAGVTELKQGGGTASDLGRWPANVFHDGSDDVLEAFALFGERGAAAPVKGTETSAASVGNVTGKRERVPGAFHGDTGTAARFFYCAKASPTEREEGCEDLESTEGRRNTHPTVKPIAVGRWLQRMVTPPGGRTLDIFVGSGSFGASAMLEGFDFVGIDLDTTIAEARVAHWQRKAIPPPPKPTSPQLNIFEAASV